MIFYKYFICLLLLGIIMPSLKAQDFPLKILEEIIETDDANRFVATVDYISAHLDKSFDEIVLSIEHTLSTDPAQGRCFFIEFNEFLMRHGLFKSKYMNLTDDRFLLACECGSLYLVKEWIDKVELGSVRGSLGATPYMLACLSGNLELTEFLIAKGEDPLAKNQFEETALFYATRSDNLALVKHLVLELKVDPDVFNEVNVRAITNAARRGDLEMVKFLIAHQKIGVDPNLDRAMFWTAASVGGKEVFSYLVNEYGLDVAKINSKGQTILIWSAHCSADTSSLRIIVEKGVDLNARDNEGKTALFSCKYIYEIMKFLIDAGIDPNTEDYEGNNYAQALIDELFFTVSFLKPLEAIEDIGILEPQEEIILMIHYLHQQGVKIKSESISMYLMKRCMDRNAEILFKYLVEHKYVNVCEKDNHGKTIEDYALEKANVTFLNYLRKLKSCSKRGRK